MAVTLENVIDEQDGPDTDALDFLDALIADHCGKRFAMTDGEHVIYIETDGAVDVRKVLDAEMAAARTEAAP